MKKHSQMLYNIGHERYTMNKLDKARNEINTIDQQMANLFEKRMEAVEAVVQYKIENNKPVFDASREQELIKRNVSLIENEIYKQSYITFFQTVLDVSKAYQKAIINKDIVAYAGTYGAFSYLACEKLFATFQKQSFTTFQEVFRAVDRQEVAYGVVPFENSYTGEVGEVSDLLREYNVYIIDTYDLKVDQNLLGIKGANLSQIKQVYSHPQAISQCSLFLRGREFECIPYANTALAAQFVSEKQDPTMAAIASKDTATLFNLDIIESNIHTVADNTTRFIVIAKDMQEVGTHFQMLFTTKNETGALAKAMNIIASNGFNMESIKSRAIPNDAWSYYFHVEIEGNLKDVKTKAMIEVLHDVCTDIKVLGAYTKRGASHDKIY